MLLVVKHFNIHVTKTEDNKGPFTNRRSTQTDTILTNRKNNENKTCSQNTSFKT